ncbi:MAG: hypothetical protein AAGF23_10405 [Acidobacteriota bacterium]
MPRLPHAKAALYGCLLALLLIAAPAWAQTTVNGQTETGAFYTFIVPDGWQPANGLVIWNHGFDLNPISENPDLGPLRDLHLSQGYAVAASSYSQIGWALFQTIDDNEQMVRAFEQRFGIPDQVFVYGASLGGAVTVQAIEQADLGNIVGALPICGALSGSRTWDGGLDVRLIYDAVCSDVPGANIPGGATGLPFPPDPNFDETALVIAAEACFGLLAGDARSDEQTQRLLKFLSVTEIGAEFIITDLAIATFGLFDLVFDPGKLAGGQGLGNANVVYGDPEIDATIQRVEVDPAAQQQLLDNYTPTGKVGDIKVVGLHTDKDGLIIVEQSIEYASIVPAANMTLGVVVEDPPTHCGFSQAETAAAWETLRGWVGGLPQPSAATMQATCQGIEAGGLAAGPCRIDPTFETTPIGERIRPRSVCTPDDRTLCLNDGRFQVTATWADFDGNTGVGRSLPQTADTGALWFFAPTNLEVILKVLDGRQFNGNFWVFYGALSNVEYEITVVDTVSGVTKVYTNPSGNFASVGDTEAF